MTYSIIAIVVLTVLLSAYSILVPEAQTSGDNIYTARCEDVGCTWNTTSDVCRLLNSSGQQNGTACRTQGEMPLGSLFTSDGVVFVIIMAAFLILIVRSFLPSGK